jgi:hypothetical protein
VNSQPTTEALKLPRIPGMVSTGGWSEDLEGFVRFNTGMLDLARATGRRVNISMPSTSYAMDPWFEDRRRQTSLSLVSMTGVPVRRKLSLKEARRMALHILHQAEEERLQIADYEAERGMIWEESP